MQVIRHYHVASNEPVIGPGPGRAQGLMNPVVREHRLPVLGADREEDND